MFNITTHCNWVYSSIHYGYETCFLFVEAFFIFDCDKTLNYHSTSNTPVDAQVIFISISNTSQVICFICPLPHIPTIMVSLDVIYNLGGVCISIVWPSDIDLWLFQYHCLNPFLTLWSTGDHTITLVLLCL